MAQTKIDLSPSDDLRCPKCKVELPPRATFCASCGERITNTSIVPLFMHESDIATRYRITSLVRRRPYVSLFFAIDNQQQRPVALREITIRGLSDEARKTACDAVQREYDLLRREHIASIMPVVDLRYSQGHLYVITGWPAPINRDEKASITQLQTLQDVLQSGIGLPGIPVTLTWIQQLCSALDQLHHHSIVLGDLDPQALILSGNNYSSELALMVSWLPAAIRSLRPPTSAISNMTNYSAPEVLLGRPEPISDVYSLGAVLYLLLTGVPPDGPTARLQRRLRSPGEINPRINGSLDDFVMKAIALEGEKRYQSMLEMAEALYRLRSRSRRLGAKGPAPVPPPSSSEAKTRHMQVDDTPVQPQKNEDIVNIDTILITPVPEANLKAWQAAALPNTPLPSEEDLLIDGEEDKQALPAQVPLSQLDEDQAPDNNKDNQKTSLTDTFKKRITGILPAIPRSPVPVPVPETPSRALSKVTSTALVPAGAVETAAGAKEKSLLKQLQRLMRGEQQHGTMAAAMIETPLRVQPNQPYMIRIQIMGRNSPEHPPAEGQKGATAGGLSALIEGELVYIEVRSALYQNYAYIVQQAAIYIPAQGYAAEITIPMQPLASGPSGRRDRLHIFFMDEMRRPLYEKPFVVELFVSHLVQPGREGHNVLPIPL
ncbi:MAG: protein kinase domain-containing protein [Ktedonobacteraceae bacterium]